jgi:hypothetical protein
MPNALKRTTHLVRIIAQWIFRLVARFHCTAGIQAEFIAVRHGHCAYGHDPTIGRRSEAEKRLAQTSSSPTEFRSHDAKDYHRKSTPAL